MSDQQSEPNETGTSEGPEAKPAAAPRPRSRGGKKERVLHTRVPAVLEGELKNLAESWRMPVSNVVRAILEDALDAMDSVGSIAEEGVRGVAQRIATERERIRRPFEGEAGAPAQASAPAKPAAPAEEPTGAAAIEGALAFSPIVVAAAGTCPVTGESLVVGEQGFLVLFADPTRRVIVHPSAVPQS